MIYRFTAPIDTEGSRAFIKIPFHVWEVTGLKGNIPCRVSILGISFECKLIPKGNGIYYIPITKKNLSKLAPEEEYEVEMEPIETLSRINHDSPYSREHPIRKIDGIEEIPPAGRILRSWLRGNACRCALSEVVTLMGKAPASWSKILEALDYYGISYAPKAVYPKGGEHQLPQCCILNNDNRFLLWYQGSFCCVSDVDPTKTISYFEIFVV